MELDPDDVFRDEEDDPDGEFYQVLPISHYLRYFPVNYTNCGISRRALLHTQERDATKELLVYIVDASPKMFSTTSPAVSFSPCTHTFLVVCMLVKNFAIGGSNVLSSLW